MVHKSVTGIVHTMSSAPLWYGLIAVTVATESLNDFKFSIKKEQEQPIKNAIWP